MFAIKKIKKNIAVIVVLVVFATILRAESSDENRQDEDGLFQKHAQELLSMLYPDGNKTTFQGKYDLEPQEYWKIGDGTYVSGENIFTENVVSKTEPSIIFSFRNIYK